MTYHNKKYIKPNFLQMDAYLQSKDGGPPTSIRCPHCMQIGSFSSIGDRKFAYNKKEKSNGTLHTFHASIRVCPNIECKGIVFTSYGGNSDAIILPAETIDFDATGIPENLLFTLTEAINCHAAGANRAAAMMVRRLLEEICDASQAHGKDLHHRLSDLRNKITLPQALFEAMGELKALGNDAAHIQAKAFDVIGPDEAADSIELAKEILRALYQLDGLVKRLQARKKSENS